jgi:agmatinase
MASVPFSFGGLRKPFSDYGTARFAVLPVPYEMTTSYMKGTAKGPRAIIDASRYLELYDEELDRNTAEEGIATLKPLPVKGGPDIVGGRIRAKVRKIASDGKLPVVLGGEHSITPSVARALKDVHGEISVLQFDAHADLRDSYHGLRHSHACAMARTREHADTVQVGIRSVGEEESALVKRLRAEGRLFFAQDVLGGRRCREIIAPLKDKVHITFDVDAFDPSIMPSTGTPEPGGLGWYDALTMLRAVAAARTVVGFDLMELTPQANKAPDFTAAKLAYRMMGYASGCPRKP